MGRTKKRPSNNVCYIFMDTGCEHPLTLYRFIPGGCRKFWGIPLTVVAGRYQSWAWAAKWLYRMGAKGYSDAKCRCLNRLWTWLKVRHAIHRRRVLVLTIQNSSPFTKYCGQPFPGEVITSHGWVFVQTNPVGWNRNRASGILPNCQILISRMLSGGGENNLLICKSWSISGTVFSASKVNAKAGACM